MKKYFLPILIALTALTVSASAAFYSVTGLTKLFAGAAFAVAIMAGSLEVAKLVVATLLHQYWTSMNKFLRFYLGLAVAILMIVTSAGIYGFLSSAFQETAGKDEVVTQQIEALEQKKQLYRDNKLSILKEKQSLAELKASLSTSATTQYTDKNGNLVVKSNKASIKQLETTGLSDEKLSNKLDIINDSILSLDTRILLLKTNSTASTELGPLKYLAKVTNQPMEKIVNWFILILVLVFDPLAIALVVSANFAFKKAKEDTQVDLEEKVEGMRNIVEAYDDLQEEIQDWKPSEKPTEKSDAVFEVYGEKPQAIEFPDTGSDQPTDEDWVIVEDEEIPVPITETQRKREAILNKMEQIKRSGNYSARRQKQILQQLQKDLDALNNEENQITYW